MKSLRQIAHSRAVDEPDETEPLTPFVLRPLPCTKPQHNFLVAIALLLREHGYSPSYREIGDALGYTDVGGLHYIIAQLRKGGAITQGTSDGTRYADRSIRLSRRLCLVKSPQGYRVYERIGELRKKR